MEGFLRPATHSSQTARSRRLRRVAVTAVFVGILALAAWLRLSHLDITLFEHDEAEWSNAALDLVRGGPPPLVGVSSLVAVATGPAFIYTLAASMLVSTDPSFVTGSVGLFNLIGVALTFFFTRRYFGPLPAALATLLYATNPWAVYHSRKIWNPNLMPLLSIVLLWALFLVAVDRRTRYLLLASAALALCLQLNQAGLVLVPLVGGFIVVYWRRIGLGTILGATIVALAVSAPYLYHELNSGFKNLRLALRVSGAKPVIDGEAARFVLGLSAGWEFPSDVFGVWARPGEVVPDGLVANVISTALFITGLGVLASRALRSPPSKQAQREGAILLLLWVLVPVMLLTWHGFELHQRYLLLTQPSQFVIAGLGAEAMAARLAPTCIAPRRKGRIILALAALPVVIAGGVHFHQYTSILDMIERNGLERSYGVPVRYYKQAFATIDRLRDSLPGEPVVWAPERSLHTIRYFTRISGAPVRHATDRNVIVMPGDDDRDRVYVDMFSDDALRQRLIDLGFQELPEETIAVPGGQTFFRFYRVPAGTRARLLASLSRAGPDSRLSNGYALARWDFGLEGASTTKIQLRTAWEMWQAPLVSDDPRDCLSQHLIDVDGRELAVQDITLEEARLLRQGDLILVWSEAPIPEDVERQQAWLDLGTFGCWKRETAHVVDPDGTKVGDALRIGPFAVGRSLGPAEIAPQRRVGARLGDDVELVGHDLDESATGQNQALRVVLYWRALGVPRADYTVFVQLLHGGELVAQQDNPPKKGRYPTSLWLEGEVVADEYVLVLPSVLPDGEYRLIAGMYTRTDMRRLPVLVAGGRTDADYVDLGTLRLERGRVVKRE